MIDVLLAGVGGQGTVLAAKVLAQAAESKGWHVRTAETIGMAQRGGKEVFAPLLARGSADLAIAFEPGEAARVLPYLAPGGTLVTATTPIQPVSAALSQTPYRAEALVRRLGEQLASAGGSLVAIDDAAVTERVGSRKVLNTVLLARALAFGRIPLGVDDLRRAVEACVKPAFVQLNLDAIDAALA